MGVKSSLLFLDTKILTRMTDAIYLDHEQAGLCPKQAEGFDYSNRK
jgi:hypothetical protein